MAHVLVKMHLGGYFIIGAGGRAAKYRVDGVSLVLRRLFCVSHVVMARERMR